MGMQIEFDKLQKSNYVITIPFFWERYDNYTTLVILILWIGNAITN